MESILKSEDGVCYSCKAIGFTEEHHIYYGHKNRKISDKMGFVVYLCPECHRGTYGIHGSKGKERNLALKRECQAVFEETHSREEFRKLIGRSYL
jgi:hypothetical protein